MGELVVAYTRNFGGASINKMEVLALSWGFIIARARGINRLAIKGDSMQIIRALKGESQSSWKIKIIIMANFKLMEGCKEIHMDNIYHDGTRVADELGKFGHKAM